MKKLKSRSSDFTVNDLPNNRRQAFFDIVKNQWRKLLFAGFLLFIGFVPFLLTIFFRDNYLIGVSSALSKGEVSQTDAYKLYVTTHLIAAAISWVSFYILVFPLGGVTRIIRQLVWQEAIFLKDDFVIGAKQNYKFGAIMATFFGVALMVSKLMLFVSDNAIVQAIPMALFLALIVPPLLLTYIQGSIYEGKFSTLFHNSVLMFIKKAPHMLLFTLIVMSPIFLKYIESFLILKYILLIVVILFILVFFILMYYLFSNYMFDKYINVTNYPELIRKGMSKED